MPSAMRSTILPSPCCDMSPEKERLAFANSIELHSSAPEVVLQWKMQAAAFVRRYFAVRTIRNREAPHAIWRSKTDVFECGVVNREGRLPIYERRITFRAY